VRTILHLDLDAFFASVEQRDDPSLRGRPVLVGGRSRRGVVAAASYEARRFGARSAMPMGEALRRCPDAVVVSPHMSRYAEASADVFGIFRRFTPLVEGLSLDEAFLDVTGSRALFGDGPAIARRIKDAVRDEVRLVVSAGVAPCKFVAKLASDLGKPDGLLVVDEAAVCETLAPLPIERMWGVGDKTAPRMHRLGLRTFADLQRADPEQLAGLLGEWGRHICAFARGIDPRPVQPDGAAHSVGAEQTYEEDLVERRAIERKLLGQAERVAERMRAAEVCARTVVVKLKEHDFRLHTRRRTRPDPFADTDTIYETARELLDRFTLEGRRFRLTGVSATDLLPGPPPPLLWPDPVQSRRERLQDATSAIHERFGHGALRRGAALEDDEEE